MKWGGHSITRAFFNKVLELLPNGGKVLELGSGAATDEFAKYYQMVSVEHDQRFVGKRKTTYIYAPLTLGWYSEVVLAKELPDDYDLLLVDGPPAYNIGNRYSRFALLAHLELFNLSVPIIFDDTERLCERRVAELVAMWVKRPLQLFQPRGQKGFGVV